MKNKPLLLTLLFLQSAISAFATDYYVATTGNDNNPGTAALPWRTIQYACDNATPGSTVYIRAGTYDGSIWTNVSGTAGNYITFTAYGNDVVTIDGGNTNSQTILWTLDNCRYIRIQGLHFAHATGNYSMGILVQNGADHIEILDNEISNIHFSSNPNATVTFGTNANPLVFYGNHPSVPVSDVIAEGNHIHDCRTGASEGLTATGDVNGFTFAYNTIHDITNIGIDAAGGHSIYPADPAVNYARNGHIHHNTVYNCVSQLAVAAGIYADGSRNILIEHNTVHDCGRGFEVGAEVPGYWADQVVVRNNITWHNREAAMGIGGYDYPSTGKVINSQLLNNTCYDNAWENISDADLLIEYTENCTIQQNIFYSTQPQKRIVISRLSSTGLSLDYNLYYHSSGAGQVKADWNGDTTTGFAQYQSVSGKDAHAVFADPVCANVASGDFHLDSGSPAYNAGDPAFVPASGETDIDGDARLQLGRVDIGADEANISLPAAYLIALQGRSTAQGVRLEWATVAESNCAGFSVERSGDNYQFREIGRVSAQENNRYAYLDSDPAHGYSYYRLLQHDTDGHSHYSPGIAVWNNNDKMEVCPNPCTAAFSLKNAENWEQIAVYNEQGQCVRRLFFGDALSLEGLPTGAYYLLVKNAEQQVMLREKLLLHR